MTNAPNKLENTCGLGEHDHKHLMMYPSVSSFEMSPCPSSDGTTKLLSSDGGRDVTLEEDDVDDGMPFLVRPLMGCEAGVDGSWLRAGKEAIAWLDLFYGQSVLLYTDSARASLRTERREGRARADVTDLVVVAVLTDFSTNHELSDPEAISTFLSYFVILAWVWTSQVHYDIRFQAEDIFHRAAKVVQVMVLVYMGAGGGNWNPGEIHDATPLRDMKSREQTVDGASFLP